MSVTKQQVSALYIAVYGRAPEASGLKFWSEEFTGSYAEAAASFVTHPLFAQEYDELSNQEIVEKFYTNILGAEGDTAGIEYWVERLENGEDMNVVLSEFLNISLTGDFTGDEAAQARQATLVNKAEVAVYYAEKMGEASEFPEGTDLNSVDVANADAFKKAAEAIANVNASAASVAAAKAAIDAAAPNPEEPSVSGETYYLEADRDVITGTDNDDTFIADIIQNQNGQQVNTLGSGDRLDGGKGNDTLLAEVAGQTHVSGGNQQIQAKTQNIENIKLQAVASDINTNKLPDGWSDIVDGIIGASDVVVSAKDMVGVNYIGSNYSDSSLIITDVNTKANTNYDSARNLNEMTIGMTYTGNQDTNWDASDLTVYFDQDFIKPSVYGKLSVALDLMNEDAYDQKLREPGSDIKFLDGVYIDKMAFTLNGESFDLAPYIQDLTGENQASDGNIIRDYADLLKATQDAIAALKADHPGNAALQSLKAELNGPFFSDISPENGLLREGTRLVLTVDDNDNAGNTLEVKSGDLTLNRADAATVENNNRYERADKFDPETDSIVETNVHLEKVGRQGDGGTLTIGSMFKDSANVWSEKYAGKGIEKFNVTVTGNEDKTNSLAGLHSTGNNLKHVTVTSTEREDGSYADLIIGNSVTEKKSGLDLGTLNGNAEALKDVQTFDATGFKGDLTLFASLGREVTDKYLANGGETVDFVYSGGEGNDTFNLVLSSGNLENAGTATHGDFTLAVNGGNGNDSITVGIVPVNGGANINANTPWYANQKTNASLSINAGNGDDTVQINGAGDWKVNLGEGNDVIYVDNSGAKSSWIFNLDTAGATTGYNPADGFTGAVGGGNLTHNLYKAGITLTFKDDSGATFELNFTVTPDAGNGYKTTQKAINNAIKDAIANDEVFSKLLEAKTGQMADTLVIDSLIDGNTGLTLDVEQLLTEAGREAFNKKYGSNISAGELTNANNANSALDATSAQDALNKNDTFAGSISNVTIGAQTIEAGKGDDVLVLGTDVDQTHTLVYKGFDNGVDTIINFTSPTVGGDTLDLTSYNADALYNVANQTTAQIKTAVEGLVNGKYVYFNEDTTNTGEYTVTVWEKTAAGVTELGTVGVLDFGEAIVFADGTNVTL